MITIKRYNQSNKLEWDNFVEQSKNGTFMLKRDYMDYHSDIFIDYSLMFYKDDQLIALLPASLHGDEVKSHGGLTYGGMITTEKMTAVKMLECFQTLKEHLLSDNIKTLIYKCIPNIYHQYPADEDLYALFRVGAKLIRMDVSTAILMSDKLDFSQLRKRGVKKALKNGIIVKHSNEYNTYIDMLINILQEYHGVKPVHTSGELQNLAGKFPDNIKLFAGFLDNKMLAGVVIYETKQTIHSQYIANSNEGKKVGALDLVMDYLINEYAKGKKHFDFGISTENNGQYLNTGLIAQKEGFGGRAVVYNFYEWRINH